MIQGVLSNPEMMGKIMGMAQSLGGTQEPEEKKSEDGAQQPENTAQSPPDLSQMNLLSGLLQKGNLDGDQQTLLKALTPYMSSSHIGKLRRAMQAAAIADLATSMLGNRMAGDGHV